MACVSKITSVINIRKSIDGNIHVLLIEVEDKCLRTLKYFRYIETHKIKKSKVDSNNFISRSVCGRFTQSKVRFIIIRDRSKCSNGIILFIVSIFFQLFDCFVMFFWHTSIVLIEVF